MGKEKNRPLISENFLKNLTKGTVKSIPLGGALLEQIIFGTLDSQNASIEREKLNSFLSSLKSSAKNHELSIEHVIELLKQNSVLDEKINQQLSTILDFIKNPGDYSLNPKMASILYKVFSSEHSHDHFPNDFRTNTAPYDYAYVKLYGSNIGIVTWDPFQGLGSFEYIADLSSLKFDPSPIQMPVVAEKVYSFPDLPQTSFQGLPGLLSDSLPDRFGRSVIEAWLAKKGMNLSNFNPVRQLLYMGQRCMGALEYSPFLNGSIDSSVSVDISTLHEISEKIMREFMPARIAPKDIDNGKLLDILRVGTSAGGVRQKVIVGYDSESGVFVSGQSSIPPGYQHYILKFAHREDKREYSDDFTNSKLEYAYYLMACDCAISMSTSFLFETRTGIHFMTKRFDRSGHEMKLHTQTLGAIAHFDYNQPGRYSYDQALDVVTQITGKTSDIEQLYRVMVFNCVARNYDDHVKNISFIMDESGAWSLAPAYDLTFTYNPTGGLTAGHQMTINGKRERITKYDLVAVGIRHRIQDAEYIVNHILDVVSRWIEYASKVGISEERSRIIEKNLMIHGELDRST